VKPTIRPSLIASATVAVALAFGAPPALAAVTGSTITSPATGTVLTNNHDAPGTVTIAGTSDGTTGDTVEIVCYFGATGKAVITDIPVQADHSFSASVSVNNFYGLGLLNPCVLRAVPKPAGMDPPPSEPPNSLSPYAGPTITLEAFERDRVSGGPNNGALFDYYLQDVQSEGTFEYESLGDCGIAQSDLWNPTTFEPSDSLFYCNDGLRWSDGFTGGPPPPGTEGATGSELRVDGNNAWSPGAISGSAFGFDAQSNPGFPTLTFDESFDPTTHGVTIRESDTTVRCSPTPSVFPPTSTSCSSFVSTGVRLDRTLVQDHDGRLVTSRSVWSSTDGASHQLHLELENDLNSSANDLALSFPWINPNFVKYTNGTLPGPPVGPSQIGVKGSLAAADGDMTHPRGIIVFARPPKDERFIQDQSAGSNEVSFLAEYDLNVPAHGLAGTAFAYTDAFSQADVAAAAADADASFRPTLTMKSPPGTTFASKVKVTGTAFDNGGVASVSVNNTATATLAPDGSWTATMPLKPGHNTLTATVTNIYGDAGQTAPADVVYAKLGVVGRFKVKGNAVVFRMHCAADPSGSCPGDALLTTKERLRGKHPLGVSARKRKVHSKRVTTGHKRFKVKGGKTVTIKVPLNNAARKLLKHFHKLPVRVTVSVVAGGKKSRVGGGKVTFRVRKRPRHA
jgi:hypothetical protein